VIALRREPAGRLLVALAKLQLVSSQQYEKEVQASDFRPRSAKVIIKATAVL
jgi:hypothetical protein